jgi:hypothetical protein
MRCLSAREVIEDRGGDRSQYALNSLHVRESSPVAQAVRERRRTPRSTEPLIGSECCPGHVRQTMWGKHVPKTRLCDTTVGRINTDAPCLKKIFHVSKTDLVMMFPD